MAVLLAGRHPDRLRPRRESLHDPHPGRNAPVALHAAAGTAGDPAGLLDPRQGRSPNWSPDRNWILFESNRGTGPAGNYQLWIASAPGSGGPVIEPVPVTPADLYAQHGEWSRQQNLIVFDNAGRGEGIGIIGVPPRFG